MPFGGWIYWAAALDYTGGFIASTESGWAGTTYQQTNDWYTAYREWLQRHISRWQRGVIHDSQGTPFENSDYQNRVNTEVINFVFEFQMPPTGFGWFDLMPLAAQISVIGSVGGWYEFIAAVEDALVVELKNRAPVSTGALRDSIEPGYALSDDVTIYMLGYGQVLNNSKCYTHIGWGVGASENAMRSERVQRILYNYVQIADQIRQAAEEAGLDP